MSKLPRDAFVMMENFIVDAKTGKVMYQPGLCSRCGLIHRMAEGAVFCAEMKKSRIVADDSD